MPLSQFDERVPIVYASKTIAPTAASIIGTQAGGTYGTRWDQFILSWNGAAQFEVDIQFDDGLGDAAFIGTVTIPAVIGTEIQQVDVLAALLPPSQQFLMLQSGGSYQCVTKVTLAGAEVFSIYLSGGNF